jgi:hypothetical protein
MTNERRGEDGQWLPDDQQIGWQPGIDFEVAGKRGELRTATAWDEDVCIGKFETRSRFVLWVRLWIWHYRFNRRSA